jgi:hypothetical protein
MKMSKIRQKTGTECILCEDNIKEGIILHKTRRQTHKLCVDCGTQYLTPLVTQITENLRKNIRKGAKNIACPGRYKGADRNLCRHTVDLTKLVISEGSPLYTNIFRITYALNNDNIVICPNKDCGDVVEVDYNNLYIPRVTCQSCLMNWCRVCLVNPFHEGKSCVAFEVSQNKTDNGKYIYQMHKKGKLHFCPACKVATLKNDGCNKMTCFTCKTKWCWLCNARNIDYNHFNTYGENPCANKLWEGVEYKQGEDLPPPNVPI